MTASPAELYRESSQQWPCCGLWIQPFIPKTLLYVDVAYHTNWPGVLVLLGFPYPMCDGRILSRWSWLTLAEPEYEATEWLKLCKRNWFDFGHLVSTNYNCAIFLLFVMENRSDSESPKPHCSQCGETPRPKVA